MNRSLKRKLAARAAVVVILAGGAVAAVTATGQGPSRTQAAARRSAHRPARRDLVTAASYLGVTIAQLQRDLGSGKSLAQVADATNGKSAAGLIAALVAEKKQKLTAAATSLPKRVTAEVNRSGGPGSPRNGSARRPGHARGPGAARRPGWRRLFAAPTRLGFVAASYLGTSAAHLQSDLKSGETLARVANATSGRSEAGLIEALVAARRARLAAALASGNLSPAKASAIGPRVSRRMKRLVNASQAGAPSPKRRRAPGKR
jgi:hypothetical protein